MYYDFRAVCAVAAASESSRPERFLRLAERLAKAIRNDRFPVAEAFANRVLGLVAEQRHQFESAALHFRASSEGFRQAEMQIHAASVDFALGRILGGDEGSRLEAAATARLQSETWPIRTIHRITHGWRAS